MIKDIKIKIYNYLALSFLEKAKNLQLDEISMSKAIYTESGRYLRYTVVNNKTLEVKDLLRLVYNRLLTDPTFRNFGEKKVIIINATSPNLSGEPCLHPNVLITNTTTFDDYYSRVKNYINNQWLDNNIGYNNEVVRTLNIKIWNLDLLTNKKITKNSDHLNNRGTGFPLNKNYGPTILKNVDQYVLKRGFHNLNYIRGFHNYSCKLNNNNFIKPLKSKPLLELNNFATMDIETISLKNFNNLQIPILISSVHSINDNETKITKLFQIDHLKLRFEIKNNNLNNIKLLVIDLFKEYIDYIIINNNHFKTIFVHNLGSFDGLFLYNGLLNIVDIKKIESIIDDQNRFILIKYKDIINKNKIEIIWKDSFRIFPVSLEELCKNFGVIGKLSKYDNRFNAIEMYDNFELFNNFIEYSKQDSIALFDALYYAQTVYNLQYKVDITKVFSTSTLSLLIFRQNFLKTDIPILKRKVDNFVRQSYFGGATDYYKLHGENLHYYDVNSLYPFAMCKPMPLKLIKYYEDMSSINLFDFFGFCKVEVESPDTLRPILPVKYRDKTIFPTGKWIGIYFSEELKTASKYGYKIKLLSGYEFSKYNLFNEYVDYFYNIKKNSIGSSRFIAKMHLNQLYGYFGRKQELINTVNIHKDELDEYTATRMIKSIIEINKNNYTLLISNNLNYDLISNINTNLNINLKNDYSFVKANVAIASAVTAYARIHMVPFKTLDSCYYTDTDSVFTDKPLNLNLIGLELGLMKDELNGKVIKEAYFLGIKQYGYSYLDDNNQLLEKSVFAGIERDSLTLLDIRNILKGDVITKHINNRFYKRLDNLSININSTKVTISLKNLKKIENNNYIPLNINTIPLKKQSILIKMLNKIKVILNKLIKIKLNNFNPHLPHLLIKFISSYITI